MKITACSSVGGREGQEDAYSVLSIFGSTHLLLADGMGGHVDGALASARAISAFSDHPPSEKEVQVLNGDLNNGVGRGSPGTTLLSAFTRDGNTWHIAWAGDSLAYVSRAGDAWVPVTKPHGKGHRLTNCVGGGGTVYLSAITHKADPGDRLLLCSDGLYDYTEMNPDWKDADDAVAAALEAHTQDNVTVILAVLGA